MLEKFEEEALEALGFSLRDENGNDRPTDLILQDFQKLWPTWTPDQQLYAAMIILIIHKRHS